MIIFIFVYIVVALYYFRNHIAMEWVYMSITYLYKKKSVDKLFNDMQPSVKRDFYVESMLYFDKSKWYNRKLEKHIRNKYIEPILKEYGSI